MEREAKINLTVVNELCSCPSEALEVLSAAAYLKELDENEPGQSSTEAVEFEAFKDELQATAIEHEAKNEEDDEGFACLDSTDDCASVGFVRTKASRTNRRKTMA